MSESPKATAQDESPEQVVTPWEVQADGEGGVNYDKLLAQFGCQGLTQELKERFEKLIGRPLHPWIERGLFFAHRDFGAILDAKEHDVPFYLYTGRGPSSDALHVGHLIPFMLIKWLQEVLDCPVVIQLTDDEKFLFKDDLTLAAARGYAWENSKDIIAVGFKPEKTFIFNNTDYMNDLYPVCLEIQKRVTFNQVKGIFGFNDSTNIGCVMFPAVQAAPCFAAAFPRFFGDPKLTTQMRCLVPYAIDQDPYFRMCRDIAPKIGCPKPCSLIGKFLPALQGAMTKMSASSASTAIYVTDTAKQIKTKINKYAFSGGQDTAEEQRRLGANIEIDVSYQYLRVFLMDDTELADIARKYAAGELLTGEVKARLIQLLTEIVSLHQAARKTLTDADVRAFFDADRPPLRAEIEAACAAHEARRKANSNKSNK